MNRRVPRLVTRVDLLIYGEQDDAPLLAKMLGALRHVMVGHEFEGLTDMSERARVVVRNHYVTRNYYLSTSCVGDEDRTGYVVTVTLERKPPPRLD